MTQYLSNAQQAVLSVYLALHEQPLTGMTVLQLTRRCPGSLSRNRVFRALHNLAHQGLVTRDPGTSVTWRLTPKAAALAERTRNALMLRHLGATEDAIR